MPITQVLLPRINMLAGPEAIREVPADLFAPGRQLGEAMAILGILRPEDPPVFTEYMSGMPGGIQEAIRALVFHNLATREGGPVSMTFAWAPAYDWGLRIWEAAGTPHSPGGITVLLESRYPGDVIPGAQAGGSQATSD